MIEIVSVRFKQQGKIYYFSPNDMKFERNDRVIVETARAVEYGRVVRGNSMISEEEIFPPLKPVLRRATPNDEARLKENAEKEKIAFEIALEKIEEHGLKMNLIEAEYTFDRSKLLFYFSSDGRVDFRELVKDLASVFRTRIELRQIGVRDEAKMLKCFGTCGRQCCCSVYLTEFKPVSIKMAKDQNLSLNPGKISGACGRLMCCLNYEQSTYEECWKGLPRQGSIVKIPGGKEGTVLNVSVLTGEITVANSETGAIATYNIKDLKVVKNAVVTEEIDPEIEEITKED